MGKLLTIRILFVLALTTLSNGKATRYMNLMCHDGYIVDTTDKTQGEGLALQIEKECQAAEKNDKICYKHCVLKRQGIINEAGNFLNSGEDAAIGLGKFFEPDSQDVVKKLAWTINEDCFNIATNVKFERCFWETPKFYDCVQNTVGC